MTISPIFSAFHTSRGYSFRCLRLFPNPVNHSASQVPDQRQHERNDSDYLFHLLSLNRPSSRPTVVLISAMLLCIVSTRSFSDLRSSLHSRSSALNQIHIFPTAPLRIAPSVVITPRMTSAEIFTSSVPKLILILLMDHHGHNPTTSQPLGSPICIVETEMPRRLPVLRR